MKRAYLAALLALAVLALTACGGGGYGGDSGTSAAFSNTSSSGKADYDAEVVEPNADEGGFYDMDMPMEMPAEEGQAEPSAELKSRLENAKLIYTAYLEVETTEFQVCAQALEEQAAKLGGYLESAAVNSYNSGYRSGNYVVRVPSKSFQTFLKLMGEIGHVIYQEKDSQNISEAYYDTESRLTTQRTKLERLQSLLAKAENMEDLIAIESAIAETELAIEQLTGELRRYDALVDYATITVSLNEVARLSSVETAPPSFGERLGRAFADGLTNFVDFLQNLAVTLAYSWLWLLIFAAAGVAIGLLVRRARKNRPFQWKKRGQSNPAEPESRDGGQNPEP